MKTTLKQKLLAAGLALIMLQVLFIISFFTGIIIGNLLNERNAHIAPCYTFKDDLIKNIPMRCFKELVK